MGFLPVPSPTLTPQEVVDLYAENRVGIQLGALLTMQFCLFGLLWTAALATQMRRIETGPTPILTYSQLASGVISTLLFIPPCLYWTIAAFRPERDADLIYMLHDLGWMGMVMPVMSVVIQAAVIGIAVLSDKRVKPIFPRWSGYMNLWIAVGFLPASLVTFFKTGPFAWNGILTIYLALTVFALWIIVMGILVAQAAKRQGLEEGVLQ
jgi:hypothetical protein